MSAVKKLLDTVEGAVDDAALGLLFSDSHLAGVKGMNVIVRNDIEIVKEGFVTLISGGGSGHEPAHAGFIGHGMLSAAVLGNVFASPSVAQILAAIRVCCGPKGCLLIVKNYTGDRLNFGMAMEKAKSEGFKVMMVIVGDDSALPEGKGITGGRGVAGTLFVHKIAGAVAAEGGCLEDVHAEANTAADKVRSMGVAFTTCTVPGVPPSDRLTDDLTYEVGLGIHGEPGREQKKLVKGNNNLATTVASILVEQCLSRLGAPVPGSEVALMVNNLGSVPLLEMLVATKCIMTKVSEMGYKPVRCYVGSFMTSLEMAGVSLSILLLDSETLRTRVDAVTTAPAWRSSPALADVPKANEIAYDGNDHKRKIVGGPGIDKKYADAMVIAVCSRLIELEPELTRCDTICGDGDCGLVLKKGAIAVQEMVEASNSGDEAGEVDGASYCDGLADAISGSMGGTSGALLELFFRAMANSLSSSGNGTHVDSAKAVCVGLRSGLDAMTFFGGATKGMRTMLDAMIPAIESLESNMSLFVEGKVGSVNKAALLKEFASNSASAAEAGRDSTKDMTALAGRANYVNEEYMNGVPDPGAVAIAAAFRSAAQAM